MTNMPDPGKEPLELNLTSMIDVIFLLLIFFVCTSDFKEPEKLLPTNLGMPGAIEANSTPQEERDLDKIVVRILERNGAVEFAVDNKRMNSIDALEALLDELRQIDPNALVLIDPERNVALENVLDVYDASRRVGLGKIKFVASPDSLSL